MPAIRLAPPDPHPPGAGGRGHPRRRRPRRRLSAAPPPAARPGERHRKVVGHEAGRPATRMPAPLGREMTRSALALASWSAFWPRPRHSPQRRAWARRSRRRRRPRTPAASRRGPPARRAGPRWPCSPRGEDDHAAPVHHQSWGRPKSWTRLHADRLRWRTPAAQTARPTASGSTPRRLREATSRSETGSQSSRSPSERVDEKRAVLQDEAVEDPPAGQHRLELGPGAPGHQAAPAVRSPARAPARRASPRPPPRRWRWSRRSRTRERGTAPRAVFATGDAETRHRSDRPPHPSRSGAQS